MYVRLSYAMPPCLTGLAGVRPPWGRAGRGCAYRGRATLTRGYRIVRPPWGRQPRRMHIATMRKRNTPPDTFRTAHHGESMPRRGWRPERFRAAGMPPLLRLPPSRLDAPANACENAPLPCALYGKLLMRTCVSVRLLALEMRREGGLSSIHPVDFDFHPMDRPIHPMEISIHGHFSTEKWP